MKEAEYQGISVEEALAEHEKAEAAAEAHEREREEREREEQKRRAKPTTRPVNPEKLDPSVRYGGAARESEEFGEWGTGDKGYKIPSTPGERLRSAWLIRLLPRVCHLS